MPNLYETHEGVEAIMRVNIGLCGPQFGLDKIAKAAKLEVWGSSFDDPGADWCRFDLFDQNGERIASQTTPGY